MLDMPQTRAGRYSIQIRDAQGSVLFSAIAHWDARDKRIALAQIMRLAGLPEPNVYSGPELDTSEAKALGRTNRAGR